MYLTGKKKIISVDTGVCNLSVNFVCFRKEKEFPGLKEISRTLKSNEFFSLLVKTLLMTFLFLGSEQKANQISKNGVEL